jgi:hypothetical protein
MEPERERWLKQDPVARSDKLYTVELRDAPPWNSVDASLDAQLGYVRNWLAGWTLEFPYRSEEDRAVEAASRGKLTKLVKWLKQPNIQPKASTLKLVAEFLSGERSRGTGRMKGETKNNAGPPRWSEAQRRALGPAHRATEIFLVFRDTLSLIYPYKSEADIHYRAMLLAEMQTGVSTETIANHLKKPIGERLPYRVLGHQEGEGRRWWVEDLFVGTNAAAPPDEHWFEGETWMEFWQSIKRRTPAARSKS